MRLKILQNNKIIFMKRIKMKYPKTIQDLINKHFIKMCEAGDLEQVRYWLLSSDLDIHAQINADNGGPIIGACAVNQTHIVKYLLTSEELTEHADIHLDNDQAFRFAHAKFVKRKPHTQSVLEYLLSDYKIKLTETIKKEIASYPNEDVDYLIKKRQFTLISNPQMKINLH